MSYTRKNLKLLINNLRGDEWLKKALEKTGRIVEKTAKENAPSVTGELKGSISHRLENGNEVHIGTNIPYAPYVEYGTGLYAVRGDGRPTGWAFAVYGTYAQKYWREDKPNCFLSADGKMMIWTRGQKPQPYLEPALIKNMPRILEVFGEALTGSSLEDIDV